MWTFLQDSSEHSTATFPSRKRSSLPGDCVTCWSSQRQKDPEVLKCIGSCVPCDTGLSYFFQVLLIILTSKKMSLFNILLLITFYLLALQIDSVLLMEPGMIPPLWTLKAEVAQHYQHLDAFFYLVKLQLNLVQYFPWKCILVELPLPYFVFLSLHWMQTPHPTISPEITAFITSLYNTSLPLSYFLETILSSTTFILVLFLFIKLNLTSVQVVAYLSFLYEFLNIKIFIPQIFQF